MIRNILVSAIFILICIRVSANDRYYALVDSSEKYIKQKEWVASEKFIKEALSCDPENANNSLLLSNLATVQRYMAKNNEALRNYSFALHMSPNAVTLLQNRASLYMQMDSIDNAYKDYDRIISLDPKDDESLFYHGMLALRKKENDVAKKDFEQILTNNPLSALGRQGLGNWNKNNGNYNDAVKYYTEIIKVKPSEILLANRAECYLALKRLNDATDDIRAALEMLPEDGYLYVLRAKLNKARFNEDDMMRDMKLAEKYGIDPKLVKSAL